MSRKMTTNLTEAHLLKCFRFFDYQPPTTIEKNDANPNFPNKINSGKRFNNSSIKSEKVKTSDLINLMQKEGTLSKRISAEEAYDIISQVAPSAHSDGYLDYNKFLTMLYQK
jgi:hypothetical protein